MSRSGNKPTQIKKRENLGATVYRILTQAVWGRDAGIAISEFIRTLVIFSIRVDRAFHKLVI